MGTKNTTSSTKATLTGGLANGAGAKALRAKTGTSKASKKVVAPASTTAPVTTTPPAAPTVPAPVPAPAPVVAPVAPPAAPVATPVPLPQAFAGANACGLLRSMGYAGYTAKQGQLATVAMGWATSPTTVSCQVGGGRQAARGTPKPHHTGPITVLTPVQVASLNAVVGAPANPHATTAPLPAPKPSTRGVSAAVLANPAVQAAQQALQAALLAAANATAPTA